MFCTFCVLYLLFIFFRVTPLLCECVYIEFFCTFFLSFFLRDAGVGLFNPEILHAP